MLQGLGMVDEKFAMLHRKLNQFEDGVTFGGTMQISMLPHMTS